MAVTIKSPREIELMRKAGEILALTHEELRKALKPGMSTLDIDRLGEKIIRSYGCIPSFKNYNGYPASVCVSVNDEVVHGIPSKRKLKNGDIIAVMGKTGAATGVHLHLGMQPIGKSNWLNPQTYDYIPPVEKVEEPKPQHKPQKQKNLSAFHLFCQTRLDTVPDQHPTRYPYPRNHRKGRHSDRCPRQPHRRRPHAHRALRRQDRVQPERQIALRSS